MMSLKDCQYSKEYQLQDISEVSSLFVKMIQAGESQVFGFKGDLGAGKTTLIKQIIKDLGVKDLVKSPTYSIQCDYQGILDGRTIEVHHWDLYRISESEAVEMYDQYLSEKNAYMRILFVEWAERLGGRIADLTQIDISEPSDHRDVGQENLEKEFHERRIICIKSPKIDK